MNILTDILSLIRQGKFAETAGKDDVVVLGMWNEKPDMTGVASPIPYKSVKLIKVKDLASSENCDNENILNVSNSVGVFKEEKIDPATGKCTSYFRGLHSLSPNLTINLSADEDYLEFDSEGEPNLAANVGTGKGIWKDKVGETLNFKSLVAGSGITISDAPDEITISAVDSDTTYALSSAASAGAAAELQLNGSDGSLSVVKLIEGSNISIQQNSNEVTIAASVSPGLGYTEYVSKIDQAGTADPTEVVLSNNTGNSLTWTRLGVGTYGAQWATPTAPLYVVLDIGQQFKASPRFVQVVSHTNTNFVIEVFDLTTGTPAKADNELLNTPVKIRIYPSI